ncbi:acyl-homoserine-lactone synthase [uncultured Tateyamaria sp.]|uniref:acyl-homoserine-lactone synthase n=1 Tax=uncultured Tateyamaria sp. TaxID=455651 RepID=UPI002639AE1C|nr:acyl-homoserine-lactone synthase [uncultured Tateyamaria sp.]
MIHFLYGDDLSKKPILTHSMFTDRAEQFHDRLGWDVAVNAQGEERDEYDRLNPLYVIVANEHGLHEASMRLLPTVGRTMVNDHFMHITNDVKIQSPIIWECTRFCVSPGAKPNASAKLMAAGGKIMQEFSVEHYVGVFDRKMLPVYRFIGSVPTVVGWSQSEKNKIGVGLWEFNAEEYCRLLSDCGMSWAEMELYFVNSGLGEDLRSEPKTLVA